MSTNETIGVSRRQFLKTATVGAAAVGLAGCLDTGVSPAIDPAIRGANERVRVACVGYADRFRDALLPAFQKCAKELNFDLVAVADLWDKRRADAVADFTKRFDKKTSDIAVYRSDEDLFEHAKDVDACFIATADFQHAFHARHAVEAGFDAYCEKPMAEDMDAANALLDAVTRKRAAGFTKGAVLQIGSQRRSGYDYQVANDYIRSGKFGKITYVDLCWNVNQPRRWRRDEKLLKELDASYQAGTVDWKKWLLDRPAVPFAARKYLEFRTFWPYSSGIPGQWMCHQIDTVAWFTGYRYPRSAMASGGLYAWNDGRQNFDTFTTVLEYGPAEPGKGFQAVFSSRQTNSARGNVEKYYSTTGTIDLIKGTVSNAGVENEQPWTKELSGAVSGGTAVTAANTGADPLTSNHVRNWMECVRARKNPNAPIEAGYGHTVALVMSNASARTGLRATFDETSRQVQVGGKVFRGF